MKSLSNGILFFLIMMYSLSFADSEQLGLNDAISISLENNNRYKIAREKVHEKDLKVSEVWGELWPELGSGASATRWDADKGAYSGSDGQYNIQIVKGSLSVNPGSFYNRLQSTREDKILTVNEERRIKADTVVNAIHLYYKVLLAQDVLKLRSDSVKALDENLRIVEAGYKNGSYTRLAFLRAGVAAANEKTRLINSGRDYEQAKSAFNLHLGREIDSPLMLDVKALELESPEENSVITMKEDERMIRFNELVAIALKNRPELLQIIHKKEMFKDRELESESIYLWPTFFVNGSYGSTKLINPNGDIYTGNSTVDYIMNGINSSSNPPDWNTSWNFTVGATYRWGALSPADSSGAKSGQFKSLTSQSDMEMEDLVRSIKLEIQDGLLGLESASHSIQSQKGNIRSAEESFRVAILQFKNGMIDNAELLNANVELSNAKALYIQSLYDFQTSKAKLNRALGSDYFRF
jgi:outer membrane protein TolC